MAAPSGAYTEALTLTLRDIDKRLFDNVALEHPLFETFKKNAKSNTGTPEMVLPIKLGTQAVPTFAADDSGTYTPAISPNIVTSASYSFDGILNGQVRLAFLDREKNKGRLAIKDRLKVHQDDLIEQFKLQVATLMYTPDASRPAKSFNSLDTLCNANVTSVGGIDSAVAGNELWTPTTLDMSVAGGSPVTDPKKGLRQLRQAIQKASGVRPDVVMVGENMWDSIMDYLDTKSGLTTQVGGDVDFEWESVRFAGVEVRLDFDCPDDQAFMLYTPALHFRWLNDNLLKPLGPKQVPGTNAGELTFDESFPVATIAAVGTNQRRALGMIDGWGQ